MNNSVERHSTYSVLVVDDNFTNRRVVIGMLSRWGVRATAVDSAQAALEALENARNAGSPIPLVLLDGHMPDMDGFALAELIRKDPRLADGRIRSYSSDSAIRTGICQAYSHYCDDGARAEGRPGTMPSGWDGWLHFQTASDPRDVRHHRECAGPAR